MPDAAPSIDALPRASDSTTHQARIAPAVATKVLNIARVAPDVASRFEPALKPNQPTHSIAAPTSVSVIECGAMHLLAEADPRPDDIGRDERRDPGIDVDHGAAGEVDRAHVEDQAGAVPHHVGDREIDERDPQRDEQHDARELDPLGEGADDQRRGDRRRRSSGTR